MPAKLTLDEFIKRAAVKHHASYDYDEVEYVNSSTKVCIKCRVHGKFWQTPHNHLNGQGCPLCGECTAKNARRKTTAQFIEDAISIFPHYDYSHVTYINNKTPVTLICPDHGEFSAIPNSILSGRGCPRCGIDKRTKAISDTAESFIRKAIEKHSDAYDYSKVIYNGTYCPVLIVCKEHGEFWQRPNAHLNGQGCPKCKHASVPKSQAELLNVLNQVHAGRYVYDLSAYSTGKSVVRIKCPEHGWFNQVVRDHLRGNGCPACAAAHNKSEQELVQEVRALLPDKDVVHNATGIVYNPRTNCSFRLDVYIPELRLALEMNGEYWHKLHELRAPGYHKTRNAACAAAGIKLVHIASRNWRKRRQAVLSRIEKIISERRKTNNQTSRVRG